MSDQDEPNGSARKCHLTRDDYDIILSWMEVPEHFEALHPAKGQITLIDGHRVKKKDGYRLLAEHVLSHTKTKELTILSGRNMHQRWRTYVLRFLRTLKTSQSAHGKRLTTYEVKKGISSIPEKLEAKCPHFNRMKALYQDINRVNVPLLPDRSDTASEHSSHDSGDDRSTKRRRLIDSIVEGIEKDQENGAEHRQEARAVPERRQGSSDRQEFLMHTQTGTELRRELPEQRQLPDHRRELPEHQQVLPERRQELSEHRPEYSQEADHRRMREIAYDAVIRSSAVLKAALTTMEKLRDTHISDEQVDEAQVLVNKLVSRWTKDLEQASEM